MNLYSRSRRYWARLTRPPKPAIIMYHRIAVPKRDPWGLAVTPENFRAQLQLMRRRRKILPLDEFAQLLRENRLPRRAVAITFDDGYRDNLVNAAPALAQFEAPATLFLLTGPMRRPRAYWWDALAAMILDAPPLQCSVRIGSEDVAIALGPPEPADASATWRASQPPRTPREALFIRLWSLIRPLPPEQVECAMTELAGLFPCADVAADGPMSRDEVRALISAAPVTLGCHTVDHLDLPAIAPEVAREQLTTSKAEVETLMGRPVHGFAYPYGRYDSQVVRLVEEVGFTHACISGNRSVGDFDPLVLPRVPARDRPTIDWLAS